jgi:hypothetical protein
MISSPSKRTQFANTSSDVAQVRSDDGHEPIRAWLTHAPQRRWGLLLPLVFAGNVLVATLAWIVVGIVLELDGRARCRHRPLLPPPAPSPRKKPRMIRVFVTVIGSFPRQMISAITTRRRQKNQDGFAPAFF